MYTQKMFEVQKNATSRDHGYLGYAVIVNKRFWEGLPADVRAGLEKAMEEATVYNNEIAEKDNDERAGGDEGDRQDRFLSSRRRPSGRHCARQWSRSTKRWPIASART